VKETSPAPVKAVILCPVSHSDTRLRSDAARLEEARGLAEAIDLAIVAAETIRLRDINPATLFGKGKVAEIGELLVAVEAGLVVVDGALSPGQQRELEKVWKVKVIDRTGLILEIFGKRARTREGQLQVELAALDYARSRLVKSWTHLERQRGGFGFLGGPGESQLEIDKRLIDNRILKIRKELDTVKNTRELQRDARHDPLIAFVGYTNAGKSTLFNRLSQAGVVAENMLFATLDPTIRQITLPSGWPALISDTVGFVSDLPTALVAAFSATLEEVKQADLILHVRDAAHPDTAAQKADVLKVLKNDLGIEADDARLLEVLNKIDLLPAGFEPSTANSVSISSITGEGIEELLQRIDQMLGQNRKRVKFNVDLTDGKALASLYQQGKVVGRIDNDGKAQGWVEISAR
jgi:GTP-binding protein HflX